MNDSVSIDELNEDRRSGLTEAQEKQIGEYVDQAFGYLCQDTEFIMDWVASSDNDELLIIFMTTLARRMGESEPLICAPAGGYIDSQPLRIIKDYAMSWDTMTDRLKDILSPHIQQKAYELWELNEGEVDG